MTRINLSYIKGLLDNQLIVAKNDQQNLLGCLKSLFLNNYL